MADSPSDAVVRTWARLVKAEHHVLGAVEADLRRADLPPLAWYDALLELQRGPAEGLRPKELETRMLLAQYGISRLLARLERAGCVARHQAPDDARGYLVTITDAGRELMRRMWPVYGAAIQHHVGDMLDGDWEAGMLADLLGRLLAPG
jgi:DNA-binding MarR family transcriptional regulator